MINLDLTGRTAIVCGSTQGIGKATAETLANLGARVVLLARQEAELQTVRAKLPAPWGQQHQALVADFLKPEQVREVVKDWLAGGERAEILINNTGGPPTGSLLEAKPDDFLRAFKMHVLCNHLLVQALVPGMKQAGYGRIVNVVSTSVKEPIPGLGVSNTTRAAVAGWAKTLAGELGQFGITVNNVLPGYTETGRLTSLIQKTSERQKLQQDAVEREMLAKVPLGRFAMPEETAAAIAFLASPAASYITGISLPVDGGRLAGL